MTEGLVQGLRRVCAMRRTFLLGLLLGMALSLGSVILTRAPRYPCGVLAPVWQGIWQGQAAEYPQEV